VGKEEAEVFFCVVEEEAEEVYVSVVFLCPSPRFQLLYHPLPRKESWAEKEANLHPVDTVVGVKASQLRFLYPASVVRETGMALQEGTL
jgi:hypothetical protein